MTRTERANDVIETVTRTERASDVIETVMRRLKARNVKEPHLVKFRMFNKNGFTATLATISVSAIGATNPTYKEDVCDIIRYAIVGDDIFGKMIRLRSETDGIITIDVTYSVGRKIDQPRYGHQPSFLPKDHDGKFDISSCYDTEIRGILKEIGIGSTVKTGSNTNNTRTETHMNSFVLRLELPDGFSKTMLRHIPKIVREEMHLRNRDKHVNANILDLHDNVYLFVSVVTKTK